MIKLKKTYRLWTFQSIRSIRELEHKGILQASWDRYLSTGYFKKSYQWMVKQMVERNIDCNQYSPIWAWHSCIKYEQAPKLVDARCLLSDYDLEEGIRTIEFECPVELALLSLYGTWNVMLETFYYCEGEAIIDKEIEARLFATGKKQFRKYDAIQATLPYLKLDWVREIRPLNLKPNDFTYNTEENV